MKFKFTTDMCEIDVVNIIFDHNVSLKRDATHFVQLEEAAKGKSLTARIGFWGLKKSIQGTARFTGQQWEHISLAMHMFAKDDTIKLISFKNGEVIVDCDDLYCSYIKNATMWKLGQIDEHRMEHKLKSVLGAKNIEQVK